MAKREKIKFTRYCGTFLFDNGFRLDFDISEMDNPTGKFARMMEEIVFPFSDTDIIWLGEDAEIPFIRACKIIGFNIDECKVNEQDA